MLFPKFKKYKVFWKKLHSNVSKAIHYSIVILLTLQKGYSELIYKS